MPLFKRRSSLLEVQNQALIETARERAARMDELERELQIAASQIGQFRRELRAQERLQTAQERISTVERDLQTAHERTSKIERDLQLAIDEVERLTLERDFYAKKASALEQEDACSGPSAVSGPNAQGDPSRFKQKIEITRPVHKIEVVVQKTRKTLKQGGRCAPEY